MFSSGLQQFIHSSIQNYTSTYSLIHSFIHLCIFSYQTALSFLTTIQPNEGENVAKESNADKTERELTALWGCVLPALSPSQNTRMAQPQYRELGWRKPPFWKNTVEPWWKTALLRERSLFTPIYWNNTHHTSMHISPSSMTDSVTTFCCWFLEWHFIRASIDSVNKTKNIDSLETQRQLFKAWDLK